MATPRLCRWGILATGGIAKAFAKDLQVDPATRGVKDVMHTISAVASSSGRARAQQFAQDVGAPAEANCYANYDELVHDKNIDIIYVATPHSHHFQNVMLCLEAGHNVLCEKSFTVNAAQAKKLIETARKKNLFLMEAIWTRYFPLSQYMKDVIESGKIGTVQRVFADLTMPVHPNKKGESLPRILDPSTAGGALLEIGIYPINWCFQAVYSTLPQEDRMLPNVKATIKKSLSGVDESTSILVTFKRPSELGGDAHGIATCSITPAPPWKGTRNPEPSVRILGTKGYLELYSPSFRPTKTRLMNESGDTIEKDWPQPGPGPGSNWLNWYGSELHPEGEARGMAWQADESAKCVFSGLKESRLQSLDESLAIMETMDLVRRDAGLEYPPNIESVQYPLEF